MVPGGRRATGRMLKQGVGQMLISGANCMTLVKACFFPKQSTLQKLVPASQLK